MSGQGTAAVLRNKMISSTLKDIYFQEYNIQPLYINNLDYKNSLLRLKQTSNQEQLKEIERSPLN